MKSNYTAIHKRLFLGLVLWAFSSADALGQASGPTPGSAQALTVQVRTGDPAARSAAVAGMLDLLKQDPAVAVPAFRSQWRDALYRTRMPAEQARVAAAAVAAYDEAVTGGQMRPDTGLAVDLWRARVRGLLASRQAAGAVAALREARAYTLDDGGPIGPRLGEHLDLEVSNAARAAKLYDDATDLALRAISDRPLDWDEMPALQWARAQALFDAKRYDAALAAAKGSYNACPLKDTAAAIDLLARCLVNARPAEKGIARRLKDQQVAAAGAAAQPAAGAEGATATTSPAEANVLDTIPSEAALFDPAIAKLDVRDYPNLMARGTLLLLADRGKEAEECFETAADLAGSDKELSAAVERTARAMRAADRGVGRANAYVLGAQQQQQPEPAK